MNSVLINKVDYLIDRVESWITNIVENWITDTVDKLVMDIFREFHEENLIKQQPYMYQEKRLHIFDLDDTLYLRNRIEDTDEYHAQVKKMIKDLKKDGKIIAMASHNSNPHYYLSNMGIINYFDIIIGEYPREKDDMVNEILLQTGCDVTEAVFYDDQKYNIDIVGNLGVTVYHVPRNGITITF